MTLMRSLSALSVATVSTTSLMKAKAVYILTDVANGWSFGQASMRLALYQPTAASASAK
jgi:hypothetical protein